MNVNTALRVVHGSPPPGSRVAQLYIAPTGELYVHDAGEGGAAPKTSSAAAPAQPAVCPARKRPRRPARSAPAPATGSAPTKTTGMLQRIREDLLALGARHPDDMARLVQRVHHAGVGHEEAAIEPAQLSGGFRGALRTPRIFHGPDPLAVDGGASNRTEFRLATATDEGNLVLHPLAYNVLLNQRS